ncbi:Phosphorus acquisition-controlling protein [Penicillium subrubescens]|uniref:Phosphorus acquisition-controlling protein n=1 Tax=Penicillium subrubescens TaxID=1316194 RepID=A0A1Q5UKN0_9EURO|nr:Phosphorus acquisition-controlling protein [Penicillium subrubescens]
MPQPTTPSFAVRRGYQPQQVAPSPANQEVQGYNSLIRAMLREIDGCKSKLEKKISPATAYVSIESKYQHILDETRVPGVSSPETTPTTLTSKRTSQKIAEQARRNRINNALQQLEALMPPTFIQDQKSQRLAGSSVTVDEAEKPGNHFFGKAFMVETAIQYINELRTCLEGLDTSARIFVPAALVFERGHHKIQEQGRRNRINVALKGLESMIPSEFIQARLAKNKAISGFKSEGNIDDKFVAPACSKASILEMANDYIRELQRDLEDKSETLALRLMPPRAPSPDGRTETPDKESRSGTASPSDDQKEEDSGSASKLMPSIDGDAISDANLPSPQDPLSLSNPGLYEAETRRTPLEGSEISQSNIVDSMASSRRPPVDAVSVKDGGKAFAGKVETQHSSSKDEIRPPPVDLGETSQTPNSREDFGTSLNLNDMQFQFLDSWVEPPRDDWLTRPLLEGYSELEDDDLQGDTILPNLRKDVKGEVQVHKADGLAWKPDRHRHKRRFSTIDNNSPSPMIFEPLIEKHQKRSENTTSQDILLGKSNQEFPEDFTDSPWPSSLEKALERWTNLKQYEFNTEIVG